MMRIVIVSAVTGDMRRQGFKADQEYRSRR